jgi:hypothetical protein
MKMS